MSGKTERFVLADRRCACFVPEGEVKGLMVLCGGQMERMLPALAAEAPEFLLFSRRRTAGAISRRGLRRVCGKASRFRAAERNTCAF